MKLFLKNRITLVFALIITGFCRASGSDANQQLTVEQLNHIFLETCRNSSFFENVKTYLDPDEANRADRSWDCQPVFWDEKAHRLIVEPDYQAQKLGDLSFRSLQKKIRQEAVWNSSTNLNNLIMRGVPTTLKSDQHTSANRHTGPKLEIIPGYSNLGLSPEAQIVKER